MKLQGKNWRCDECGTKNDNQSKTCANCGAGANEWYTSKYKTSRITAKAVSYIGWFIVLLSVYGLLHLGLTMMSLYLILGGFFSGFLLVIAGQVTRATIDSADNTAQMLALMKSKNEKVVE
jgi:hypothetical protein